MLTGRKALSQIDRSLQTVRNESVRLDGQLASLAGRLTGAEQQRMAILRQIAEVRLSEIENGALQASFSAIDNQVKRLLAERERAIESLNLNLAEKNERIAATEKKREAQLEIYNSTAEQLLQIETKVQAELKLNVAYLDQLKKAEQAESVAEEAEHKVAVATQDLGEKAEPYQADRLFMYLWERGYGTTRYDGGLLSRLVDGWVARLIKFEDARVNFWNLNEIPKRLTEHAERVGSLSDEEFDKLQAIERNALNKAGAEEVEQSLTELRQSLDDIDDLIEEHEIELNTMLGKRAEFDAGEDQYFKQCLDQISEALAHQSLEAVNRYVRETRSMEDDRAVLDLQSLEVTLNTLKGNLNSVRKLHDKQISKLRDLEGVRHQFKNSRFDDLRSEFANEGLIHSVLNQFLQGLISGADLWGTIKRNQRYREQEVMPDFGSGGVGDLIDVIDSINRSGVDIGDILRPRAPKRRQRRKSKGSTWHVPTPRRNGGGFQFPRAPKSKGGGFKTGGGF